MAMVSYYLLVRSYPERKFLSLWVIRRDGSSHQGVLYGEVLPGMLADVVSALGLEVVREEMPLPGAEPVREVLGDSHQSLLPT